MQAHHAWSAHTTTFWAPTGLRVNRRASEASSLLSRTSEECSARRLMLATGALKRSFRGGAIFVGSLRTRGLGPENLVLGLRWDPDLSPRDVSTAPILGGSLACSRGPSPPRLPPHFRRACNPAGIGSCRSRHTLGVAFDVCRVGGCSVGRGQTRVGFRLLVAEGWRVYSDRLQGGVFD